MRVRDITEYGLVGPYNKGATKPQPSTPVTTPAQSGKPSVPGKTPEKPTDAEVPAKANATDMKTVYSLSDIPKPKAGEEPTYLYDPISKNPVGRLKGNKILDLKTNQAIPIPNWLRSGKIGIVPKTESVWAKFLELPLVEQLRIVENIDVNQLNRIINEG